ncbi:hypothetical protein BT93_J1163 [Corymbia citriodora subsp. variegata]|nr:hypothetical protein BT93_J1163 [Corymbia citriodora subsp. variegata]
MDSPLLSPRTESCETSEAPSFRFAVPPDPDLLIKLEGGCWRGSKQKHERMPSDEQQYWKNPCIYRVPAFITKLNTEAYKPHVVSFGPYHHHSDERLVPMEEHKNRVLERFLKRSGKSLEDLVNSLREVEQHIKESYDVLNLEGKERNGDWLLELMIKDGCFMPEIMKAWDVMIEKKIEKKMNDYLPSDPIFSTHRLAYKTPYIRRDMLMLENQLPMLVLYWMATIENIGGEDDVNKLILKFFHLKEKIKYYPCTGLGRRLHVLDVVREGLLMEPGKDRQKKKNSRGIFFAGGVLTLPIITVDDNTESMFLNVMTFERLHIGAETEVTSYVNFMDNIINDRHDVVLLHAQGIIQNAIGSDKAVANLFNSLCKEVTVESINSLDTVQKDISKYCEQPWNSWRSSLTHTYFKNPWTTSSLIAALFLFVLGIIQTIYAVLSYY